MPIEVYPLFPGIPGGMELAVILLIAILLFGANKIPKLARSTGEAMGEFKKGREQVEQELQDIREGDSESSGKTDSLEAEEPAETETETEKETDTDEQ